MGAEASLQAPSEDEASASQQPMVSVLIKWPHGARNACICGTFNDWKQTLMSPSQAEPGTWIKVLELSAGIHQYKFIIDGQWKHDPAAPTVLDALGNVNNYITVKPPAAVRRERSPAQQQRPGAEDLPSPTAADRSPMAERKASPPNRDESDPYMASEKQQAAFTQDVPAREDLLVQHAASMLLPRHLLLILPHLVDGSEKPPKNPVHVQLNHVFVNTGGLPDGGLTGSVRASTGAPVVPLVYSLCVRYRSSYVTTVMYKPPRGSAPRPPPRHRARAVDEGAAAHGARDSSTTREVRFLSISIPTTTRKHDDKAGREYASYDVEAVLSVGGAQTTLRSSRRYTHFRLLDQMLRREFGSREPYSAGRLLPPKRTFGNLDERFVQERRAALEKYLQACIESVPVSNSPAFCHFVDSGSSAPEDPIMRADSNALLERISTKQGYLLKQSTRRVSWKQRYFCLYDTELLYYYSEEVSNPFQPLNIVHIEGATVMRMSLASMRRHACFVVRTSQHEWWMAANSEAVREDWIAALTAAGAVVSTALASAMAGEEGDGGSVVGGSFADSVDMLPTPYCAKEGASPTGPVPAAVQAVCAGKGFGLATARSGSSTSTGCGGSMAHTGSSGGSSVASQQQGGLGAGDGPAPSGPAENGPAQGAGPAARTGTLFKRPSKVHIAHDLGNEPPWVARHFSLLPQERLLVYRRDLDATLDEPQGILPLSNFSSVEEINLPGHGPGLKLLPPVPSAHTSHSDLSRPDDSPRLTPMPPSTPTAVEAQPAERHATESVILLAASEAERRQWMDAILAVMAMPAAANGPGHPSTGSVSQKSATRTS